MKHARWAIAVLLLLLAAAGCAGRSQDGGAAEEADPYAGPIEELRALAQGGDAGACDALGQRYENGRDGATEDPAEAVRWYRTAADAGHAEGQYHLGRMLARGVGVEKDEAAAADWYRKAAAQQLTRWPCSAWPGRTRPGTE
jgi:TPR repeat protein